MSSTKAGIADFFSRNQNLRVIGILYNKSAVGMQTEIVRKNCEKQRPEGGALEDPLGDGSRSRDL